MNSYTDLINELILKGALHTSSIIEAFKHIDRANFVSTPLFGDIYGDYPLQIGHGQTISQPSTVAMMLEMLEPKEGEKILDIGSGSGWTTALLAFIVKKNGFVTGVERVENLVELGQENLAKYSFSNAKIIQANDTLGIPGEKFDRILVSAAADELPYKLLQQLKTNGKLVIPIQDFIYEITKLNDEKIKTVKHYGFAFVPLIY